MKNNPFIERGMMLAIALYPISMLSVKGSLSGLFFALIIMSALALYPKRPTFTSSNQASYIYAAAMISVIAATLLSQAYHDKFNAAYLDSPARFMFAIPIYLALQRMNPRVMSPLQYGLPLGAIAALFTTLTIHYVQAEKFGERATNLFLNPIHFGDLALMLGILSACSINWLKADSKYLVVLKFLGLIAGLYASALSGTRGGWIAIPAVLLAWFIFGDKRNAKKLTAVILTTITLFTAVYLISPSIQQRVNYSHIELQMIMAGNLESSFGQRIQIWKGATQMFLTNPIAGVGPEGFSSAISKMGESGYISRLAAEQGACEVHNQFFSSIARLGAPGLISYLLIHFVPLTFFIQAMKSAHPSRRKTGLMGLSLVVSFITFGLTVEMYNLKMVATFYALTIAVLLAICHNIHHDETTTS